MTTPFKGRNHAKATTNFKYKTTRQKPIRKDLTTISPCLLEVACSSAKIQLPFKKPLPFTKHSAFLPSKQLTGWGKSALKRR
jgi:hypothetical protein